MFRPAYANHEPHCNYKNEKKGLYHGAFFFYLPDEGTPLEFLAFPWPWPFDPYSLPHSQMNLMSQGCH
jgi:hypothetical protein